MVDERRRLTAAGADTDDEANDSDDGADIN